MRVLIACEFSGVVRNAFRALDYDAYSCDLLPADDNSEFHIQCDVRTILNNDWQLLIAHPPCTRLCNSGVRWLHERDLWDELYEGAELFKSLLHAPIKHIAVENPTMHKYALDIIGEQAAFCVQPWMFGHGETKRTCFWTRNLPTLEATNVVSGRDNRIHYMSPSVNRWKERSKTYTGVAEAMATQWGGYVNTHA